LPILAFRTCCRSPPPTHSPGRSRSRDTPSFLYQGRSPSSQLYPLQGGDAGRAVPHSSTWGRRTPCCASTSRVVHCGGLRIGSLQSCVAASRGAPRGRGRSVRSSARRGDYGPEVRCRISAAVRTTGRRCAATDWAAEHCVGRVGPQACGPILADERRAGAVEPRPVDAGAGCGQPLAPLLPYGGLCCRFSLSVLAVVLLPPPIPRAGAAPGIRPVFCAKGGPLRRSYTLCREGTRVALCRTRRRGAVGPLAALRRRGWSTAADYGPRTRRTRGGGGIAGPAGPLWIFLRSTHAQS
jgi:hypothetical protein